MGSIEDKEKLLKEIIMTKEFTKKLLDLQRELEKCPSWTKLIVTKDHAEILTSFSEFFCNLGND